MIWPLIDGKFIVGDAKGCVAVATTQNLDDVAINLRHVAIVGKLTTENVGIDKLIENIITNQHIRFLVLHGRKNLATQALLALQENGIDTDKKIIKATSKKAQLTIPKSYITRFRRQIKVVDATIAAQGIESVLNTCAKSNPGPFKGKRINIPRPPVISGSRNNRFVIDPKGYFLVRIDRKRKKIIVEHIKGNKTTCIITADNNEAVRDTVARMKLIGQFEQTFEHAMYLAREVFKAELALKYGYPYEQDEPLKIKRSDSPCS